jgi:REP element-mobilizing transposase RayT
MTQQTQPPVTQRAYTLPKDRESTAERMSALPLEEISCRNEPPLTLGSCILGKPEIAAIVQNALLFFERKRYHLAAWVVMPNHVHAIVTPLAGFNLSSILHSWKSFTANQINKTLGRTGALWERESFDHLVRSPENLDHFVRYVENNPVEAGLCGTPQEWLFSSCGAGFQPASIEFPDPRKIPFASVRSRGELPHLFKEGGTYFITFRLLDAVQLRSTQF